ncbi:MAG: hypothetical protein QGG48_10675 [Desulfatiglandales bacterium]|nr:hypothetical protein [Desulfatiglandales bacterium]
MNKIELTLACEHYDRTEALREGKIKPEGIDLICLSFRPHEIFWRMIRHTDFDIAEMSLAAYIIGKSRGESRFTAIPVFPSRGFRHSAIYINVNKAIVKPEDLKGKKVGVPEYQVTAAVWVRGILKSDYGVDPKDLHWFMGGQEEPGREERIELRVPAGVSIEPIPEGCTLSRMLDEGELDALISPHVPSVFPRSAQVRRLFQDFRGVEKDFYGRTGVFPIMHTVVIKSSLWERYPWISQNLYKAFCEAKDEAIKKLYDANALFITLPWVVAEIEEETAFMGGDVWPYGVEPNKNTIQMLINFLWQQGLLERNVSIEELFAPNAFDRCKT